MHQQRPIYLNLLEIRLPVAGVMSILHRASGLLMFLLIPVLLYLLDQSLRSAEAFNAIATLFHGPVRWLLAPAIWALCHHLLAGLRFLLLDIDIGLERATMRASAWLVNIAAVTLTLIIAAALLL
jgi:succinate dehydrogenase / fumarate reductase cytochrome b subunit